MDLGVYATKGRSVSELAELVRALTEYRVAHIQYGVIYTFFPLLFVQ